MKFLQTLSAFVFLSTAPLFSNFDVTIPVLDMQEFYSEQTHEKFIGELYDALKEVGFFALVNTGADMEVLDKGCC